MILEQLLQEEKFQYLHILNHKPDLSRTVSTVESTETPDVSEYIPESTLLLMTGMIFQDNQEQLCEFLEEMNHRACAGIAIKLGRFLDHLDEKVIETADRLGMPLIQIPMHMTLGDVYHEILAHIWHEQNDYLLNALNTQKKISNLILQGSSMKSIINNVTVILDRPVMIVDLFGNIQDYGYTYSKAEREKTMEIMGCLMDRHELDKDLYYLHQEEGRNYCIYPMKGVGKNTYYMVVLDFDPTEREELMLVMEQIMLALELYFYRELYIEYNQMRSQEEFLTTLIDQISDKTWNERQVLALGDSYGLMQESSYQCVVVSVDQKQKRKFNPDHFSKREEQYILIYKWLKHMLQERLGEHVLVYPQESEWRYILLIQGQEDGLMQAYTYLHDYIEAKFGMKITIAQGRVVASLLNMKSSYQEAVRCLEDGNSHEDYPYLLSYRPRNMMELFKFVPEREMKEICTSRLKELSFPQNEMHEELRKTLQTYLACGSSITKTAESMFLHRNTIKYRIKKCEEILGMELSNVTDCFQIQLALVLSEQM